MGSLDSMGNNDSVKENNEKLIIELIEGSNNPIEDRQKIEELIEKSKQRTGTIESIYDTNKGFIYSFKKGEIIKELMNPEETKEKGSEKIKEDTSKALYSLLNDYKNNNTIV